MKLFNRQGRTLLLLTAVVVAVGLSGCVDDNGGNSGGGNNTVYTLQISTNPIGGGTVSRNPEKSTYSAGEQVTVTAQPASGYRFVVWSGVSTSASSSVTVTMNANLVLTANFQQQSVTPPDDSLSHTHTWGNWVVTAPATCEVAGVETRTCTLDASHKETRAIPKLTGMDCNSGGGDTTGHVHVWGNWVVTTQATCAAAGVETRTCTLDASHKETRAIAQLTGTVCNSGGGESYAFVVIGGKKWMKKNLNIETADSWCYRNSPDNCAKYGRLYTWVAAKTACPNGWHLPSVYEWDQLAESVGGTKSFYAGTKYYWLGVGKKLKSTTGWYYNGNGTDTYGFSALPGGNRNSDGSFINAGDYGDWWAATEDTSGYVPYRTIGYDDDDMFEFYRDKSGGSSVRCVSDN